jgi:hypothetical protein
MSDGDQQRLPIKLDATATARSRRCRRRRHSRRKTGWPPSVSPIMPARVGLRGRLRRRAMRRGYHALDPRRRLRSGNPGGRFRLPAKAAAGAGGLQGRDFIFDVQTHLVNPVGGCGSAPTGASGTAPSPASRKDACGKADPVACFSAGWLHQAGARRQRHAYGGAEFPAGAGPNANVCAERASTWRFLRRDRTAAAHAPGKLLRCVGEERVRVGHGFDLVRLAARPE